MNLQEAKAITNLCLELTGKEIDNKTIITLFPAPLIRERINEIITNYLNGDHDDNSKIIFSYEDFEVLVLFKSNTETEGISPYTVTPIEEIVNKIFNNLPWS